MTMPRAGIALGSNLGNRLALLRAAHAHLCGLAIPNAPVLTAPAYQTPPLSCPPGSPDFLNTVVEIGFVGDPLVLLEATRNIEQKLGRIPASERNASRVIDIDLLYLGNERVASDTLVLPHPRIGERGFVLQPLADIRPDLLLPGHTRTIAELLQHLRGDEPPLAVWLNHWAE